MRNSSYAGVMGHHYYGFAQFLTDFHQIVNNYLGISAVQFARGLVSQ